MNTQGWRLGTSTGSRSIGFRAAAFGVLAVGFIACAGDDTPPVDNTTRDALAAEFPDPEGQQAAAGTASSGGGAAGAGGSGAGAGGSSGRAGAGSSSAGTGGSGGSGQAGAGSSADVCDAFGTILTLKCNGGNCHGDGAANGDFAASEAAAAAGVDQQSTRGASCGVLIDPNNTEDSLIYKMVAGTQDFGACFPVQMPLSGDNLSSEELDCVQDWLTQFAD
jgi:hypothetical protein